MKKILLAFDGEQFSRGAFEFARRMNDMQPVMLIGVFLPHLDLSVSWTYATAGSASSIPLLEKPAGKAVATNILKFEQECNHYGIKHRVHKYPYDLAIPELRKETRFADLLILGSEKFYENFGMETPNEYLRMTVQDAECPVVLVPEKFTFPESIVLSYDGSDDSTHAIRSFTCLFPQLTEKQAVMVYAAFSKDEEMPDKDYAEELVSSHFSNLSFKVLPRRSGKHLNNWLSELKHPMLVSGSYGRSDLSMMFRKSFVTQVINDHKLPIFIAHR